MAVGLVFGDSGSVVGGWWIAGKRDEDMAVGHAADLWRNTELEMGMEFPVAGTRFPLATYSEEGTYRPRRMAFPKFHRTHISPGDSVSPVQDGAANGQRGLQWLARFSASQADGELVAWRRVGWLCMPRSRRRSTGLRTIRPVATSGTFCGRTRWPRSGRCVRRGSGSACRRGRPCPGAGRPVHALPVPAGIRPPRACGRARRATA